MFAIPKTPPPGAVGDLDRLVQDLGGFPLSSGPNSPTRAAGPSGPGIQSFAPYPVLRTSPKRKIAPGTFPHPPPKTRGGCGAFHHRRNHNAFRRPPAVSGHLRIGHGLPYRSRVRPGVVHLGGVLVKQVACGEHHSLVLTAHGDLVLTAPARRGRFWSCEHG